MGTVPGDSTLSVLITVQVGSRFRAWIYDKYDQMHAHASGWSLDARSGSHLTILWLP